MRSHSLELRCRIKRPLHLALCSCALFCCRSRWHVVFFSVFDRIPSGEVLEDCRAAPSQSATLSRSTTVLFGVRFVIFETYGHAVVFSTDCGKLHRTFQIFRDSIAPFIELSRKSLSPSSTSMSLSSGHSSCPFVFAHRIVSVNKFTELTDPRSTRRPRFLRLEANLDARVNLQTLR